jgi:N-acylglucosamine-6-phosphate 2-epimerase
VSIESGTTRAAAAAASTLSAIKSGLVVSCQAPLGSPLRNPTTIASLAEAALLGGALGVRVNGPADVAAVRALTRRPIIGLHKVTGERRNLITPSLELAAGLVDAGADMVAIEMTTEAHGNDFSLIGRVVEQLGCAVMADVSTLEEGLRARDAGAHVIGTTLSGYTPYTASGDERPDFALVAALARAGVPVIGEGRYRTPDHVAIAFEAGAWAVVVGGAITDPLTTTQRFSAVTPRMLS